MPFAFSITIIIRKEENRTSYRKNKYRNNGYCGIFDRNTVRTRILESVHHSQDRTHTHIYVQKARKQWLLNTLDQVARTN